MPATPVARTRRLLFRDLTAADAVALSAVLCDPEVMRHSDSGLLPAEEIPRWIEAQRPSGDGLGRRAVVEAACGVVAGYAGLTRAPGRCAADEAELGLRLARSFWGRGLATEAATALVGHGLADLRLRRVVALVDPGNRASIRVLERIGMRCEGEVMLGHYTHPDLLYVIAAAPPG